MKTVVLACMIALAFNAFAYARPRRSSQIIYATGSNQSAQAVAEACAREGRLAHRGGHYGHEGLGMASTKEAAYRNCCFATSGMPDADVGFAQDSSGMWYCCRRYAR
jgi:hypothetical protein